MRLNATVSANKRDYESDSQHKRVGIPIPAVIDSATRRFFIAWAAVMKWPLRHNKSVDQMEHFHLIQEVKGLRFRWFLRDAVLVTRSKLGDIWALDTNASMDFQGICECVQSWGDYFPGTYELALSIIHTFSYSCSHVWTNAAPNVIAPEIQCPSYPPWRVIFHKFAIVYCLNSYSSNTPRIFFWVG